MRFVQHKGKAIGEQELGIDQGNCCRPLPVVPYSSVNLLHFVQCMHLGMRNASFFLHTGFAKTFAMESRFQ